MKTKLDLPSQVFNYKPVRLAGNLLEKVRKNGVGAIAPALKSVSQSTLLSQSALKMQQQISVAAKAENRVQSRVDTQTVRSAQQDGQTSRVAAKQVSQGETQQQSRQEVAQHSQQVVQGQKNGKPVFSNVERDTLRLTIGSKDSDFQEVRVNKEITTRNVVQKDNATRVTLSIESASNRTRTDALAAKSRTETETQVRTYDSLGNLLSEKASRQAVTTTVQQEAAVKTQAEASRQVGQETTVETSQEGKKSVRAVTTETTDVSKGHQQLETQIQTKTATLVENLGADGEVLSAKASAQQVNTNETRTIDSSRDSHTEQTAKTISGPKETGSSTHTEYEIKAATVDRTTTTATVDQFNGDGKLVSEQAINRQTTTTSLEDRSGQAESKTSVSKEKNGDTLTETGIKSEESVALATRVVSEQNGAKSERAIETKVHSEMQGAVLNEVSADGQRNISFDILQKRESESDDLTANANGQSRLVETESKMAQLVQGQIEYSPNTQQVGSGLGTGSVIVQISTAAGLRASFRLDQGTLEFDFSSETAMVSHQEVSSGNVVQTKKGETSVKGTTTDIQRASFDSAHFQGRVVASVDAQGNRVFELDGKVVQDSAAVLVANGGQGAQAEVSHTELDVNGRLAVNQQVSSKGSKTVIQTETQAELNVARVENRESAGINMPSLTHLTAGDAVRAGFQAYRGALQLSAAGFNVSISFVA